MQITDIIAQMGGLQSMAQELGVSESQAASGVAALIPAILGGFKKQAQSQPTGSSVTLSDTAAPGLASMLDLNGDGNPLDDILRRAGKAIS